MRGFIEEFRGTVEKAARELEGIDNSASERRGAPAEWSAKEILGHLIDSAANNHRRFVEAQWMDELVFPSYDQDRWVAAQQYQRSSWLDLIALWKAYNLHLVHVVENIPPSVLRQPRQTHNLDRIAWQTVSPEEAVCLEYLIQDYLGHLKAHLEQIFAQLHLHPPI